MPNKLANRKDLAHYMNIAADGAAEKWVRMGEGYSDMTETMNPNEYTRHYIDQSTETTDITGYSPSFAYTVDVYTEEPTIQVIEGVTVNELVGNDARCTIVTAFLYRPVEGSPDVYKAQKREYTIVPDGFASGVDALILSGNLKAATDSIAGVWDDKEKTFTAG